MTDESMKAFLAQFEKSKKNIEEWPTWMQKTAFVATASLPHGVTPPESAKEDKGEPGASKS